MAQNTDYSTASSQAIEADLGARLQALRLARNVSQATLAEEAGVSRRTITRLEHGDGTSLDTLIRVMRALGLADRLDLLLPDPAVRPVERVRLKGRERQRAREKSTSEPAGWSWDPDAE